MERDADDGVLQPAPHQSKSRQKTITLAAVSALALLAASPAAAQDRPTNTAIDAAISPPGYYVRGTLGLSFSPEDEIDYSVLYGLGLGYRIDRNLRVDFTMERRDRFIVEGGQNFAGVAAFDSKVENTSYMLNVYYDFERLPIIQLPGGFKPFVGAGIGISRLEVNDQDVIVGGTGTARFTGEDKNQLSWQIMASVAYKLDAATAFEIFYRYADLGEVELSSTVGSVSSELTTHELMASIRYHF
jgi:opacity protein-like surface antigen